MLKLPMSSRAVCEQQYWAATHYLTLPSRNFSNKKPAASVKTSTRRIIMAPTFILQLRLAWRGIQPSQSSTLAFAPAPRSTRTTCRWLLPAATQGGGATETQRRDHDRIGVAHVLVQIFLIWGPLQLGAPREYGS